MDNKRSLPIISERTRIEHAYAKRQKGQQESFFNVAHLFIIQERERRILEILKQNGLTALDSSVILEIGCGNGSWLCDFIKWGAQPQNIVGIDLLLDRILQAKRVTPKGVHINCGDATSLPFKDMSFDIILQSTVFTSVLDLTLKQKIADEMVRSIKSNGLILWYDFHVNHPFNPDVQGVKKREIKKLFPHCHVNLWRMTLAPPLVRLLAPYSLLACYILERFKVFNTHYLGIIRKL